MSSPGRKTSVGITGPVFFELETTTGVVAGLDGVDIEIGENIAPLAVTTIHEDGSASYNFYIEGTADRLVEPQLVPADIACFGTVSLALEPGASRYAQLLKDFAAQGTLVALDPNIRPFYATP